MKRLGSALVLSVALTSGCSGSPEMAPSFHPAPESVVEIPKVHIPEFPAQLPDKVRKMSAATIALQGGNITNNSSGVRLNHDYVLTSGHALIQEGSSTPMPGAEHCVNITAYGPSKTVVSQGDVDFTGSFGVQERVAGTFDNQLDAAMFKLLPHRTTLPEMPEITISDRPLQPGEVVYFANFEPDSEGNRRNPMESQQNPKTAGKDKRYDEPAIYAGVVLGKDPQVPNNVDVVTGFRSYGAVPDTNSRRGSSGGVLFDTDGEAVALVSRGYEGLLTPAGVAQNTGMLPEGVPANEQDLSYTLVQPLNQSLVHDLQLRVNAAPACQE